MEAEDFLQEGFIKIYKDLNQFSANKGAFKSWAYRVVINVCLQKIRAKKSNLVALDSAEVSNLNLGDHDSIIESLSLQELTKLIQTLPEGYRLVFNMFVIDGYSHKDIAEALNVSESTSKTQLLKAKRKLQQEINILYDLNLNQYG
jgi:RNA polymerase sigma-70 factor (ECF subfamily)